MLKTFLLILIALLLCGNLLSYTKKNYKENITAKGIEKLLIYSTSGEISIVTENRDDIYVELDSFSNGPKLYIENGTETIIESKRKIWNLFCFSFKSPKLRVYIPEKYKNSLYVKNTSGNVFITSIDLDSLGLFLTSGNVELKNIRSSTGYLKNTSGNILIEESKIDDLEVKLTSGRLDIDDFSGNLKGKSTSGSVNIDLEQLNGDIIFKLTSGKMNINIDYQELNSNLNLKTTSGKVVCDFPVTTSGEFKRKSLNGVSGNPDYNIDILNTSGSIYIENN